MISMSTRVQASKLHAYTLRKTAILDARGKKVAALSKGIVFSYKQRVGDIVKFNYFGKTRYVKVGKLVTNSKIESFVQEHPEKFEVRIKTLSSACVYSKPVGGKVLKKFAAGETLQSLGSYGDSYKVLVNERFGYVRKNFCHKYCMVDVTTFPAVNGNSKGQRIVNYAKKFVGNPYVWGGTSLTSGADCSGFVQAVYKVFGYSLPRCSYQQACVGKKVSLSKLRPGDLIFYQRGSRIGHVTMYAGNGMCVQARGRAYGIVITRFDYSEPALARRII